VPNVVESPPSCGPMAASRPVALADRSKRLGDASSVKSGSILASLRVPFYLDHRLLGVSGESFGAPLMPVSA
jgi:hypothetical protein